jgi:cytochrome b561
MRWKSDRQYYGMVAILLHWSVAVMVLLLFLLGLWMTGLEYYHPWYRQGPDIHRSIGVLLFGVLLVRLAWRWSNPPPEPLPDHTAVERITAGLVHRLLYLLLFCVMLSGYLISTADGRALDVFGWFELPALITGIELQEEIAGRAHLVIAVTTIALVAVHIGGAFKHHFVDRDRTLLRIFGR